MQQRVKVVAKVREGFGVNTTHALALTLYKQPPN